MSEPNSPLNPQAEPGLESSLDWWNPFPELTDSELNKTEATSEQSAVSPLETDESALLEVPETVPVNSYVAPVVVSSSSGMNPATANAAPTEYAASAVSDELAAVLSEQIPQSSEPPNLIDLISLIQELNQCNGVLLDRVSQLEEALERSQQALKGQIERSPEAIAAPQSEDLAMAQAQIANLFSQLEFAHQTNQRQHILIETLTAELESSQERTAQLEREAALLQQRYNEQLQLLVQSEGTCRDLQARLQRQQRYTLQFKAALEKCLEMPMPQTDSSGEMIAPPADSLLPKAQQIQPWSQPAAQESLLPWMKRFKVADEAVTADAEQAAAEIEELLSEIVPGKDTNAIEEPVRPKVSAVQLPVLTPLNPTASDTASDIANESPEPQDLSIEFAQAVSPNTVYSIEQTIETVASQLPDAEIAQHPAEELAPGTTPPSISYDLKSQAETVPPTVLTRLDEVVQPLADRLAEALLAQATGTQAAGAEMAKTEIAKTEPIENQPSQIMPAEFPSIDPIVESDDVIVADPDRLLASAMSEAEDALWQDLARLIEVSPEEAVKASLTGDLAAFESLNFEASEQAATTLDSNIAPELPAPATQTEAPREAQTKAAEPQLPMPSAQKVPSPALAANPNSPSPLLHPSRPAKAKRSMSSVELPSFLRQEDSKPLPT